MAEACLPAESPTPGQRPPSEAAQRIVASWRDPAGSLITSLGLGASFLLLFATAVAYPTIHDEHFFVAAGRLIADGLRPYRDFHCLQMPYGFYVFAAVNRITDVLLLGDRLVNVVASWTIVALLQLSARRHLQPLSRPLRDLVALLPVAVVLASPAFMLIGTLARNDALGLLASFAGALILSRISSSTGVVVPAMAGALTGLAVGCRLIYAVPAAVVVIWLVAVDSRRWRLAGAFTVGACLALLPALWLFLTAPSRFLFDNVGYHQLQEVYHARAGTDVAISVHAKLVFLANNLIHHPTHAWLLLALILAIWARPRTTRREPHGWLAVALAVTAFQLSPTWLTYWAAPLPFAVAWAVPRLAASSRRIALLGVIAALAAVGIGARSWQDIRIVTSPAEWKATKLHQLGRELAETVHSGPILTLAPSVPLEGGLEIYPELASGAFIWRTAPLLEPSRRHARDLVGPAELRRLTADRPPAAVLLGFEGELERPLYDWAIANGYHQVQRVPFLPPIRLLVRPTDVQTGPRPTPTDAAEPPSRPTAPR